MNQQRNHIIRIHCTDQKGLIHAITGEVLAANLNIVVMKEFVETSHNQFFTRLEVSGAMNASKLKEQLQAKLPVDAVVEIIAQQPKQLVLLVTREHHCLTDLLVRHHFGELNAEIKAVIGNYDALEDITRRFDIPFITISHQEKDKAAFEREVLHTLQQLKPDYLVLAKFMRILSPQFVAAYPRRIINIHHSFLPAFIGAKPYHQAYERGVKLIGATAHFVTNDLDEGPIITQRVIGADHEYDVNGMVNAGHEVEKAVLFDALKLVLEDRVFVTRNRTIIFD